MSIKKSLLATGLAALSLAVLTSTASANPHLDYPGEGGFTATGGEAVLSGGAASVTCTSSTSEGDFETKTTGWVILTFHGCKSFGTNCQSGAATGTIESTKLTFHLVTVTKPLEGNEVAPAVLLTPNHTTNVFSHHSCPSLGVSITVGGNGIIGEILAPGYNEASTTTTTDFNVVSGAQEHRTVHGSETEYGLTVSVNGGAPIAGTQDTEGTATLSEGEGELTE